MNNPLLTRPAFGSLRSLAFLPRSFPGFAVALPMLLSTSCGGDPQDDKLDAPREPAGHPAVGTVTSKLVSGFSIDASTGLIAGSSGESETDSVTLDSPPGTTLGLAVAFNAIDNIHVSAAGTACPGYSVSALSYFTNGTFRALRIPTLSNLSALFGDPSIAVGVVGGGWVVYVGSMGVSTSKWNSVVPAGSCLRGGITPDVLCENAVFIPADGSAASVLTPFSSCSAHLTTDTFDGTSMYWNSTALYMTSVNKTLGRVDVYANGVPVPAPPFAGLSGVTFTGHAIFPKSHTSDSIPTVIAPDTNGFFWLARYDEQQKKWTTAPLTTSATSPPFGWGESANLNGGASIHDRGYTADYYQAAPGDTDNLWFFYETKLSVYGTKRLQGVRCTFSGVNTIGCTTLPGALTPAGSNAILPSVISVNVENRPTDTGYRPWLSYWTDATSPGNVAMIMAKVDRSTGALTAFPAGPDETPCPRSDGYWGEYDSMTVLNNGSSQPGLLRYLTDSTASNCQPGGGPMHVSLVVGNGSL